MKTIAWKAAKLLLLACLLVVVAGLVAPMIGANHYREQIQAALQKALGRRVEVGEVHLNVFTGVGFAVERVVIHEDPAFGVEPVAYVGSLEAVPRAWSLFTRKLEFTSIRLDDASINLTKTGGPAEPGRWNFAPLLTRSLITAFPEIHVRTGRINFKFGDTKSAFYLTNTDLDISPPSGRNGDWSIRFSGAPARTDRPARGFGNFTARGRWSPPRNGNRDNLDLNLELEESSMAEMITLLHGENIGIHGGVSARLRLRGPFDDIRINGRMTVEDVHRWDLLPPKGQGWPMGLQGRLNLAAQTLELESSTSEQQALPLAVRVRVADYLSQPRWAASLYWNRFPLGPVVDLARHMGAPLPEDVKLAGTIDGAVTWEGGMRGHLSFRDTAVAISNTPPIRFGQARLVFDGSRAELTPAVVRLANDDEAQLAAAYDWKAGSLDIAVSTANMHVEALRSQVALAAVPWLDQVTAGTWNGELHYGWKAGAGGGWSGEIELAGGELPLAGVAEPLKIETARVRLEGAKLALDRMQASVGKLPFQGEYRYEPQLARPHRFRLTLAEVDAPEIERLLLPTLSRRGGLLARALGRAPLPDWLAGRRMEGSLQIGALVMGATRVERLRGQLVWDGTRARLQGISGRVAGGTVSGVLTASLKAARPVYLFSGRLKTVSCRSGKADAEGVIETRGAGRELLANLRSHGVFSGQGLELGLTPSVKSVSGTYRLAWAKPEPRLSFQELELEISDEVYTGRGATQEDGRLLIELTSPTREMRVSGTLAKLRVEEPAP